MTPEQTTELLQALNHHDWFLVVCGIVWLLGTILQFLIVAKVKSAIENKQYFTHARYDKEMEIYQKVWPKLVSFWEVIFYADVSEAGQQDYGKTRNEMIEAIRMNKPFFPKEIWQEVQEVQKLCESKRFSELLLRFRELNDDEKKNYFESSDKIKVQLDKVEEAIRNRLGKFD